MTKVITPENAPWYRWRFNIGTALVAVLLGWMAWGFVADAAIEWPSRVGGFLLFGGLSAYCVRSLWVNRYPLRFQMPGHTTERRFQFGLRNMLACTFWICIWLSAWYAVPGLLDERLDRVPEVMRIPTVAVIFFLRLGSPIMAFASLFGNPKTGLLFSAAYIALLFAITLLLAWLA